jgi:hypothetical protein
MKTFMIAALTLKCFGYGVKSKSILASRVSFKLSGVSVTRLPSRTFAAGHAAPTDPIPAGSCLN